MFKNPFGKKEASIEDSQWPFSAPRNEAVITSKGIMDGSDHILFVTHDEEDGGWQFLSGESLSENDAAVVGLGQIAELDPTVFSLSDLPEGWTASRASVDASWHREEFDADPDA